MKPSARAAGGVLITAMFLVLVLAGLGIAMSKLSNVSEDAVTKANLSAKAYYGAKAGLEWGIQRAIAAGSCAGGSPALGGALTGVSVTVTCVSSIYGAGSLVYYITSQATTGTLGSIGYAERRMEATVSNIP
jgi:MSHA biogenesis protein MshP